MTKQTAIIIGAGPAGLTAAYELTRQTDIRPIVLEASDMVGGIARTINYRGNRIDIGGHRFFSKSERVLKWWFDMMPLEDGVEASMAMTYRGQLHSIAARSRDSRPEDPDRVMLVRNRKSHIYCFRRFFDYPLSLTFRTLTTLGLPRVVLAGGSYLRARCFPVRPERTLEDFFINRFGRHLYHLFFESYTEKVWGVPCREISAEWGAQRIKGLSIVKAVIHAAKKPFRSVDIRQKDTETSLIERFLYPKLGPGQMWETCAKRIEVAGGEIRFDSQVVGINWKYGRVLSVTIRDKDGREFDLLGDYFISTMPVKNLVAGFHPQAPQAVQHVASGLVYRDFLTVGLLVRKLKSTTPDGAPSPARNDTWMYIQEPDVRIGRLQIFNNWSPHMVADSGTTWLGLEYFCNEGDDLWSSSDEELGRLGGEELDRIGLIDRSDVLDHTVVRMQKTYPAYFGSYDQFGVVRDFVDGLENLFLVGRNGMHRYNNQDHSMLTAMKAVENIRRGLRCKSNIWEVNTEQEYHEEVDQGKDNTP